MGEHGAAAWRRMILGGVGALSMACVGAPPPPPGAGGSTGEGSSSSGQAPDDTTGPRPDPSTDDGDPPDTTSTTGTPAESSSSGPGEVAMLWISDEPSYDFGVIPVGNTLSHVFTVINYGPGDATGMSGELGSNQYQFTGGAYPGAGGSCTDSLAADASCEIEVGYSPVGIGLHAETLIVAHDDGLAARDLLGGGAGETINFLLNPGGEMSGSPPPDWINAGAGEWTAGLPGQVGPYMGGGCLYAEQGPSGEVYQLAQVVDVQAWGEVIDQGGIQMRFGGYTRNNAVDNDQSRIWVRYLDDADTELDLYDTGWGSTGLWFLVEDIREVPAGTRSIEVTLGCTKVSGILCNAYFDQLELTASYP